MVHECRFTVYISSPFLASHLSDSHSQADTADMTAFSVFLDPVSVSTEAQSSFDVATHIYIYITSCLITNVFSMCPSFFVLDQDISRSRFGVSTTGGQGLQPEEGHGRGVPRSIRDPARPVSLINATLHCFK